MKRVFGIMLIMLAAAFVLGCAGNKVVETGDTSVADAKENGWLASRDEWSWMADECAVARHGNTIYSISGEWMGQNMIYATDLVTGESAPLCSKPGCEHKDEACIAHVGWTSCLTYSNGRIWRLEGGTSLRSIAADGSDRIIHDLLDMKLEWRMANGGFIGFYKDRLYRCGWGEINSETSSYDGLWLYARSLDGQDEAKELLQLDGVKSAALRMHENNLYIAASNNGEDGGITTVYSFDMDSETLTELYSGDLDIMWNENTFVRDDALIFTGGKRMLAYSLKDGGITDLYPNAEDYAIDTVSEDYALSCSDNEFTCYDSSGNAVSSGNFEKAGIVEECLCIALGSVDNVFLVSMRMTDDSQPYYKYLVSIDPKTGEVKVLTERLHGIYLD